MKKATVLKYSERLQMSQTEKDSQESQYQVEQAKLQLSSDILATQQSVMNASKRVDELKGQFPLKSADIISAQGDLEGFEQGLKMLKALESELF